MRKAELRGWLLDVYAEAQGGVALWLLADDGRRLRLRQAFPVTFYAAGPAGRLRQLWRYLQEQPVALSLGRLERRDLFQEAPVTVLSVQVASPAEQPGLFQRAAEVFPDLTYYDADIPLALRYAAACGAFPLARCAVAADEQGRVQEIAILDTPWELDAPPAPLRILDLQPEVDPARGEPKSLLVTAGPRTYRLLLEPVRPMMVTLRSLLERYDPDLLLSRWGDTWLLPRLLELSRQSGLPLPLGRDPQRQASFRRERSYFSYGQVIYRGRQVHLFGRWHIDRGNAMLWSDYDLDGALEAARVTALPVQTAARVSPGTGISSMQIVTALRLGVLVPWHKQQVESPKTALQMFASDQGGLVYQPTAGLHRDVAELDFVSMYPGIMVRFNISPETVGALVEGGQRPEAAGLQVVPSSTAEYGLIPQMLAPLLQKRLALKSRLASLPAWHPERQSAKRRSSAHKWLLVTCFGYLGYKNARFGRIEAHEAVTAYGREALLRAKEAAEDLGYSVLHLYVDGMWVHKPGAGTPEAVQPLVEAIAERTTLPIALEGIFRWVAFLSSRLDARVPVANRYFGVYTDGELKVRGIEARRGDAPVFIAEMQMQLLERLGGGEPPDLAGALTLVQAWASRLQHGKVVPEDLLVEHRLSKELEEYRGHSAARRAALQLERQGKTLRAGQHIRFLYTLGEPGVFAWDQPQPPDPRSLDIPRYTRLLLRAALAVLEPFGVTEAELERQALGRPAWQLPFARLSLPARSGAAGVLRR